MAGKVKKKGDDAPQSKTARASLRTGGGKAEFIAAADAPRIVPLGGGTHAYILDPRDGKTRRFKVASGGVARSATFPARRSRSVKSLKYGGKAAEKGTELQHGPGASPASGLLPPP